MVHLQHHTATAALQEQVHRRVRHHLTLQFVPWSAALGITYFATNWKRAFTSAGKEARYILTTPNKTVTFNQPAMATIPPESCQGSLTFQHPSPLLTLWNMAQITCFLCLTGMTQRFPLHILFPVTNDHCGAPALRLVPSYFRYVADSYKPGSKVALGFLFSQTGKGWGVVRSGGLNYPLEGFVLLRWLLQLNCQRVTQLHAWSQRGISLDLRGE